MSAECGINEDTINLYYIAMSIPTKELKFIHITKTAGSSIETVGLEKNKRWGINHSEYGFWHALFPNKPTTLKEKYDWFMVVRNPYKRILSEYHFLSTVFEQKHNKEEFNSFVTKWINNASNDKESHPMYGRKGGDHFTEQYKYLDPNINIHILKFENIEDEFNELMNKYSYNIILNKKVQVSKKIFGIKDFSKETLELIQRVYKKDFELFGYSVNIEDNVETVKIEPKQKMLVLQELKSQNKEKPKVHVVPEPSIVKLVSDNSIKNKIKYIPVTRIGNKYINDIATKLGLKWGENHGEYGWKFEMFTNKNKILKEKYSWFLVVRDPYTRILSEYDFLLKSIYINKKHTLDEFNSIISKWIQNIEQGLENNPKFGKKIGDHFTEQYKYYDPEVKTHIIRYENIQDEMRLLLKEYNIEYNTPIINVENFTFTIDDISTDNIKLINRVYNKDFDLFNYFMRDVENIVEKQLKFIHITRTGGTSIEQCGLDSNKFWGRYDISYGNFDEPFTLKHNTLKQNYSWFTVVRNPYTRIISEYNYLKIILRIKNSDNITTFNSSIEKWLNIIKNSGKVHGWHLIPQYMYIDSKYDIKILKFENLREDFNQLMESKKYDIKLNRVANISNKNYSVKDLSQANIDLIKQVYKKDFEQFEYSIDYNI